MGRSYYTGPAFPSVDPVSLSLSTLALSDDTILETESCVVTLTAKRASGVAFLEPSTVVVFTLGAGTSDGVLTETRDMGDGTYSCTFLALTAGTARTIGATIAGVAVTSALPSVTVSAAVAYDSTGISPLCFASDDYTSYADSTAFRAACSTSNTAGKKYWFVAFASLASIDTVNLFNGRQTLLSTLPVVSSPPPQSETFQPQVHFSNPLNNNGAPFANGSLPDVWLRARLRFEPGFWLTGNPAGDPLGSSGAYKLIFFGLNSTHGSGRLTTELIFGGTLTLAFGAKDGPSYPHECYSQIVTEDAAPAPVFENVFGINDGLYRAWDPFDDGQYYDWIIHKGYTAPRESITEWWLCPNGETPVKIGLIEQTVTIDTDATYGAIHDDDPNSFTPNAALPNNPTVGGIFTSGSTADGATTIQVWGGSGKAFSGTISTGHTFTIAGEAGAPVHTVTNGPYVCSSQTTAESVTFTTAVVGTIGGGTGVTFSPVGIRKDAYVHANHVAPDPEIAHFALGVNYNRDRTIALAINWASWEGIDGTVHGSNPFDIPVAQR